MRQFRDMRVPAVDELGAGAERWEEFGVDPSDVPGWKALGFGPFEASMAHGDGFTPTFAVDYRRQLSKTAASWTCAGLGTPEGLRWHRAGFAAKEATRWRSLGVDVDAARALRAGYHRAGPTSEGTSTRRIRVRRSSYG